MKPWVVVLILFCMPGAWIGLAHAQNPFTSKSAKTDDVVSAPKDPFTARLYVKIAVWQYQLREKMSSLIRGVKEDGSINPLLLLMGIAFIYGAVHSAGPRPW